MNNFHSSGITSRRITMSREEDGYLRPWKCEQEDKRKHLCSIWWNSFSGGEAYINPDGSVSYDESHYAPDSLNDATAEIHTFLAYDRNKKAFYLSDEPDYEAGKYLPIGKQHKRKIQKRKAKTL